MSEITKESTQTPLDLSLDVEEPSSEVLTVPSSPEHLEINTSTLDLGYKKCRESAKRIFGPHFWMISNTTGEERRALHALGGYLSKVSQLQDRHTLDGLPSKEWESFRDEVAMALNGQVYSPELAALQDAVNRFEIPQQFIFDPLNAADQWMRSQGHETMDQYNAYTSRMGGSALAACMPIFETTHGKKPRVLQATIGGGQALFQTQLLAHFAYDARQDQVFLPTEELETCKIDLEKVKAGEVDKSFRHLCRLQVSRIEPKFQSTGKILNNLELDGQRAFTSLLAWAWRLLMKIKSDPASILEIDGPLSKKEKFILKSKHYMGLEGGLPFIHPEHH